MVTTITILLLAIPALLLLAILLSMSYQLIGRFVDERVYPPHGERVDVGGYHLHISTLGEGSLTVVMDTGLGHTSQIWSLVQPQVAQFTRACTYDRAGYGWSDAGPQPRTSQQIVKELHTLLKNADLSGPYILVGHSFGGLNMYLYAIEHPEEVAGLVLVDAVSKDMLASNPEELQWFIIINRLKFRIQSLFTHLGLFRLYILFRGPYAAMSFVKDLPKEVQRPILSAFMRRTFHAASLESSAMGQSVTMVHTLETHQPPLSIPLIVLVHGVPDMFMGRMSERETQEAEQRWQKLQASLATLSTQGELVIAEKSGHKIHIDAPDVVVTAIRELVERAHQ